MFVKEVVCHSRKLLSNSSSILTVCLGNEAADADSIISALCCAAIKTLSNPTSHFVPVVGIRRKELRLRRDVELLLKHGNVDFDDLICVDDHNFSDMIHDFILLDHNSISPSTRTIFHDTSCQNVLEIIDHHADGGQHLTCAGFNRNIAFDHESGRPTAGSSCTLIHEQYLKYLRANSIPIESYKKDIGVMLLGVILLDTLNMDVKMQKGTPRDQEAIAMLHSITSQDCNALYCELSTAKTALSYWEALCASDCLLLDYKLFGTFGVSSILLPVTRLLAKDDICEAIRSYLTRGCAVFMAMSLVIAADNTASRQLLIVTSSPESLDTVCSHMTNPAFNMQLTLHELDELITSRFAAAGLCTVVYDQASIAMSRKQVAPILSTCSL